MMENRDEVEILATPKEVWNVLTDLDKHAEWNPLIYHAKGEVKLRQTVKVSARTSSRDMNYRCLVVRVEPNQEFQWNWHVVFPFLVKGEHIFRIEPINESSVRFINREIFKGILIPFLKKELLTSGKDAMVAMDKALKERVEQLNNPT